MEYLVLILSIIKYTCTLIGFIMGGGVLTPSTINAVLTVLIGLLNSISNLDITTLDFTTAFTLRQMVPVLIGLLIRVAALLLNSDGDLGGISRLIINNVVPALEELYRILRGG